MKGYNGSTVWTIKYRRRRLGIKKYLYGEVKKHKAWIRAQAIKQHGNRCELCGYKSAVDTHHIVPKHQGGPHEVENLMVVCPNCHALITRRKISVESRRDIPKISREVLKMIKVLYSF
jgi:5-methylcytosine-specific restriction endonuclease McrA